MSKHLVLALTALALAAGPATGQRATRAAPHSAPDQGLAEPVHDDLLVFWTQQYGFRSDPEPGSENQGPPSPFTFELMAKAPKDECFIAIGQHTTVLPPGCPAGSVEKANELYLWGMALEQKLSGDESIWFGTSANTPCLANGSLGGLLEPSQDSVLVCEYAESRLVQQIPVWPAGLGDYRPPRLLRLDVDAMMLAATLEDLSPQLDFVGEFQLQTTAGIRAVGIADGVVLFAGPALTITGAVNFFAFGTDGTFLGSQGTDQYANVRRFVNAGGDLYVGMLNSLTNIFPGGSVLRWTGGRTNPFAFEVVGRFDNEVGELAVYTDDSLGPPVERLVAGTWPRLYGPFDQTDALYGLFESPPLPLDPGDAFGWSELWRISHYEPDPVTARAIASGGIAFHEGYIWFGTLITIGIPVLAWIEQYGIPFSQQQIMQVVLGTYRPLTFFRGRKVGREFQVDVLYGNTELPVYQPFAFPAGFVPMPTLDGPPLSGLGGFDNLYNTYTWSVQVGSDDLLYVGTLDNSFTLFGVEMLANQPEAALELIAERDWGADLWVFGSGPEARPVMTRGFGNNTNSGIRNLASGNTGLYAGTGNVSNITPEGGWELVRVISPLMGQN